MANSISSVTTGTGGIVLESVDTSGNTNIKSGGTTIVAVSSTGAAVTGTLSSTGNTILGDASTDTLNVGNGGLVKDASGNVGIGTASPTALLHVQNTNDAAVTSGLRLFNAGTSTGTGDSILFTVGTGQTTAVITGASSSGTTDGYLAFSTRTSNSATTKMTLDASGALLVGAASLAAVTNTSAVNGWAQNAGVVTYSKRGTTAAAFHYAFYNTNGEIGNISTSGSTTSFTTSSDYRLKENVQPMMGALSVVQALKPVTYNWKVDGSDGQGFIAHELAEVVPNCVIGEKDAVDDDGKPKYQGIDTSFLVATLTAAIQEQQALITSLTARLDEQQAQISVLQGAK
jgi:hypothetical protein